MTAHVPDWRVLECRPQPAYLLKPDRNRRLRPEEEALGRPMTEKSGLISGARALTADVKRARRSLVMAAGSSPPASAASKRCWRQFAFGRFDKELADMTGKRGRKLLENADDGIFARSF